MLESMEKLITDENMLPPGCTVLCAVSGGADSVCLLHALYRLRPRLNFRLAVAHYNHGLRGGDSDRDATFVAQFVELNCGPQRRSDGTLLPAIPLYTAQGDVAAEASLRGTGIEETARDMRYTFLRQVAREIGASRIAVAHTADDNLETILFHLTRGSGLQGLTGIHPVRGDLIRPLLTTPRHDVEQYLFFHALPHREDPSNRDLAFARNRIRHQVVPVLESITPGLAERTSSTAAYLRADEEYLSGLALTLSQQAVQSEDRLTISASILADAPDPLATRAVRQLIARLNGGDHSCSSAHLEAVVRLCRAPSPSGLVYLPGGRMAQREYDDLVLTCTPLPAALEQTLLPLPGEVTTECWRLTTEEAVFDGQPQGPFEFWLRRDEILSLTIRSRRTGDQLTLPGRPNKSVKKWLIDEKIPRILRDTLPVLDWVGQPAAVAGLGPQAALLPEVGQIAWHIRCTPR